MLFFSHLIDRFCIQSYLRKFIPHKFRRCNTKYRLESYSLAIESERYKTLPEMKEDVLFVFTPTLEMFFTLC